MCPVMFLVRAIRTAVVALRFYRDKGLGYTFPRAWRAARRHAE